MKSTIVQQGPLRLIVARSARFPEENRQAFASLESRLSTLKGRKFFGLAYPSEKTIEYYAGLVPHHEVEEQEFTNSGFQIREVNGGLCARVKLHDWMSKLDQIGSTFSALASEFGHDSSRPQMEFYRSQDELHLLAPIPNVLDPS